MKRLLVVFLAVSALCQTLSVSAAEPLRIFIRSGPKSHGPGAHDHPSFLRDWMPMLNERGAKCTGSEDFPTAEQLAQTDVLIIHRDGGGNFTPEHRTLVEGFVKRGGGIVVIHAGSVADKPEDSEYYKNLVGGSWKRPDTKWLEAPMSLYFTDRENPITKDVGNFDLDDEIYFDMDIRPDVTVLAAAYTPKTPEVKGGNKEAQARAAEAVAKRKGVNIYDIQPQMWTYTKDDYRAFVCIPGHYYRNFSHNSLRTTLLRGIAWAGKRANLDELCKPSEVGAALRYPEGGCPSPQELPEALEVHPEFNISLVAAEPLINKPMNIDWDEKGRLWVTETPEYPNGLREANVVPWMDSGSLERGKYQREPMDRVSILEDTDGDGVMDKKTVFADKLELATSSVFYKNGIIVSAAPNIWRFEDTDGDGKADKREKLYTNLGIRDTHAVINNMRWGLDGWIYATHGYSSTDDVTSGDGSKHFGPIGSGVVRFRPDGSAFEQYASRGGNTWGLDITTDGQVFYTQPTSGVLFHHVVLPEYVLAKGKLPGVTASNGLLPHEPTYPAMHWDQQAYVQIDQVGSYTAGAGCAIYEGGAWPAKWNYGYFTTEPTLNIVSHFMVEPDGVSYKAHREPGREQTEFIRSKNLWFRPIEVRVGPDGALYVVDFCNQAVIHNDTRGPTHGPANAAVRPDRDHYYGRIWKVQHKEAKTPSATAYRHRPEAKGEQGSVAFKTYQAAEQAVQSDAGRQQLLNDFSAAQDDWTRSAIIAACSQQALPTIEAAIAVGGPESLASALLPSVLPANAGKLVSICASAGTKADALKVAILNGIDANANEAPALTPDLTEALKKLLAQPALASATLPLVTKWDKGGVLKAEVKAELAKLMTLFRDGVKEPEELRLAAAMGLVGARDADGTILGEVFETLGADSLSTALKLRLVQSLGEQADAEVGKNLAFAFARLPKEVQPAAFEAILKRPEATNALLDAVKAGAIDRAGFAPGDVARLRSHPNKQIARRSNEIFKINNAAKDAIIAKLAPEVEKAGDAAKGKMLFTAACAVCHKLGDIGALVGPPLDGMGAHGPSELLVHIVDPNREVDPSFWAFNITTKKGEVLQGVVTSENAATVSLATQTGLREIAKADIDKRENTRRSLMPEGLDALGAESLRDILAFICGDAMKQFRILNLGDAYTADSRGGVFAGPQPNQGQVKIAKLGNFKIENVPFFIQDPAKSAAGANLIVLKGGPAPDVFGQSFPAKVEIPIGVKTKRLQMLSGISGWGWPAVRDEKPAMKATVVYDNGEKESFEFINGIHFADYIRPVEVPGSKYVEGITDGQQMRLLTVELTKNAVARTLILESPAGNLTTPVVAAITADIEGKGPAPLAADVSKRPPPPARGPGKGKGKGKGKGPDANANIRPEDAPKTGGPGDGPLAPTTPVQWEAGKTKVLVIGGGSSHNFMTFFGTTDVETLKAAGFSVHYTEDRDQAAAELANADVAVISVNRKFFDTMAYRKAVMDFAAAGKGLVMLHPGTWYAFPNWPELNAQIVGGGARGHDKLGDFTVNVVKKDHPIMVGVPASFGVTDELYYMNAEGAPEGTAGIEVLAETSPSVKYGKSHPSVWVTHHPKARVVGIALGHDERVHDLAAFRSVLTNAVKWAGGK